MKMCPQLSFFHRRINCGHRFTNRASGSHSCMTTTWRRTWHIKPCHVFTAYEIIATTTQLYRLVDLRSQRTTYKDRASSVAWFWLKCESALPKSCSRALLFTLPITRPKLQTICVSFRLYEYVCWGALTDARSVSRGRRERERKKKKHENEFTLSVPLLFQNYCVTEGPLVPAVAITVTRSASSVLKQLKM